MKDDYKWVNKVDVSFYPFTDEKPTALLCKKDRAVSMPDDL